MLDDAATRRGRPTSLEEGRLGGTSWGMGRGAGTAASW